MDVSTEQWLLLTVILATPTIYVGYRLYKHINKPWEF